MLQNIETVRITFECPHCGHRNEIVAADLHETTPVNCSHCRRPVAPLSVLAGETGDHQTRRD